MKQEIKEGAAPVEATSAGAARREALAAIRERKAPAGFRRLELWEPIVKGDWVWPARMAADFMKETICDGSTVEEDDLGFYYRPVATAPSPEPAEAQWAIEHDKAMLPHLFATKDLAYAWLEENKKGAGTYWVREVRAW